MQKRLDLTGQRFGRLIALEDIGIRCRNRLWECRCDCGKITNITATNLRRNLIKSCGCFKIESTVARLSGNKSYWWKGGRINAGHGYVGILRRDHPNADKRGYVLEHILKMSEHLNRPLRKGETVHHKNGIITDNRLENLELWIKNHGNGQRVEDLIPYWVEMLRFYSPEKLTGTSLKEEKRNE